MASSRPRMWSATVTMIGENLLRYNKDQEYLFFDGETTSLNLNNTVPWQWAWIIVRNGEILSTHDNYVWWDDLKVGAGAAAVTGFDYEFYKSRARPQKEVLEEFNSVLYNERYIPIGHNILRFDSMVHATWCRINGLKPDFSWQFQAIDTNCIAKAKKLDIKPDMTSPQDFLAWQIRMGGIIKKGLKTNLVQMGKDYKIDFDYAGAHNGVNDIKLNSLVWDKLKWDVEV